MNDEQRPPRIGDILVQDGGMVRGHRVWNVFLVHAIEYPLGTQAQLLMWRAVFWDFDGNLRRCQTTKLTQHDPVPLDRLQEVWGDKARDILDDLEHIIPDDKQALWRAAKDAVERSHVAMDRANDAVTQAAALATRLDKQETKVVALARLDMQEAVVQEPKVGTTVEAKSEAPKPPPKKLVPPAAPGK